MLENHEKPGFTFFAFLPPYFGVSGFLVPGMRKISMRSIDWYQKFLTSCRVAWYSAVFLFYMDYYYSPVRRGTTDRYPATWSDGTLIILLRLMFGPSLGELHFVDTPSSFPYQCELHDVSTSTLFCKPCTSVYTCGSMKELCNAWTICRQLLQSQDQHLLANYCVWKTSLQQNRT